MPLKMSEGYCGSCGKATAVTKPRINHILHLLLTVITGGFWFIIWVLLWLLNYGGWRCNICGSENVVVGRSAQQWKFNAQYRLLEEKQAAICSERPCPYCAESIKRDAIVCKHCLRNVPVAAMIEVKTETRHQARSQDPSSTENMVDIIVIVIVTVAVIILAALKR